MGGCSRDWSRLIGSYGNNTLVIWCPALERPKSAARGTCPQDNKSWGCCRRNFRPTVINPDYTMTKQRCIQCIYDKMCSPPNRAMSPTCLHCDVTHPSVTTGVVALHIPLWRVGVHEEHNQARKTVWPVNAGRVICYCQNYLCGIINHHKHIRECFFYVLVEGLSIITMNHIDTGAKTAAGTRSPLWRTRLLDAGSCYRF